MKYIIFIFCSLLICSCAEYETIGKYRYKVVTNNVNSGEFQGLIFKSNVFINQNNDTVFSKLLKAQKLYFEKKSDSVFAFGRLVVTRKNEKVYACAHAHITYLDIFLSMSMIEKNTISYFCILSIHHLFSSELTYQNIINA